MADSDNESGGHNNSNSELSPREQDRFLPIANVSRIMKKALPANAKISKDAKETVQECVSEFISFITGEASDKCQREKRKTINGDDLLWAMTTLGFEEYVEPLKVYLLRFRDMEGEKTAMAGRQGGDSGGDGGGGVSGSVVNYGNSGVGFGEGGLYGGMASNAMMMGHQHHQGHVYGGSGGYHHQMGSGGGHKIGSGYPGSGRVVIIIKWVVVVGIRSDRVIPDPGLLMGDLGSFSKYHFLVFLKSFEKKNVI
ncbi:hypothetical protein TEA_007941 [Camellia sinensis var. sinensis]|uniref:Transcription factor CBF/NF-Y/archaeal histone domain-containing protein n=1 Tax=Camellia sinensis var. sinensis TaxID=542762 RepID=A0A4V3WQT4_CAMSN|nr:hypothetical protein TEA_007941 [Camellia sinensis var. sinensis]